MPMDRREQEREPVELYKEYNASISSESMEPELKDREGKIQKKNKNIPFASTTNSCGVDV
jgi:hypothetical protein